MEKGYLKTSFNDAHEAGLLRRPVPLQVIRQEEADLGALWAAHGLGKPFGEAIGAMTPEQQDSLRARTRRHMGNPDFIAAMLNLNPENVNGMLTAIADLPSGMELVTTTYERVSPEQNRAVWDEFQNRAEPEFYKLLVKEHEAELREAGFCNYAIQSMRNGTGPTNSDGVAYNVDIDHVVERAGGGAMSTEQAVDPALDGDPTFRVNHMSNFCFIMRATHKQKNVINGLQDLGKVQEGEKKVIIMAVPEAKHGTMLIDPALLGPSDVLPSETAYFGQGPARLLKNMFEEYDGVATFTPENGREIFKHSIEKPFAHLMKVWEHTADVVEKAAADGPIEKQENKQVKKTCKDYLVPLIETFKEYHMPQEALAKLEKVGERIDAALSGAKAVPPPSGGTQKAR
ncbi:MAG: hypothetical protein GC185_12225 [Alphaproteobacteria bacterium]|nr:hypothetical protein [Alphaproteobacteria bacterium]